MERKNITTEREKDEMKTIKAIKDHIKDNTQLYIFLILSMVVTSFYAFLLCNQTLPYAEGWYTYYAQCINEGQVVYRDFEYLFSPVYIYFIAFVTRIFGYKLIVLRVMGVAVYAVITALFYLIALEIVEKKNSWMACVAAVSAALYLQSEVVQIFYDYIRIMDIFALLTTLFLLKTVKKMVQGQDYRKVLVFTGLFNVIFLNIKQNMGILFLAFTLALLVYLEIYMRNSFKQMGKDLGVFLIPVVGVNVLFYLVMLISGSLSAYLRLTGSGAVSAKGGMKAILFNWIINNVGMFEAGLHFTIQMIILIAIGLFIRLVWLKDKKDVGKIDYIIGILFVCLSLLFIYLFKSNEEFAQNFEPETYLNQYGLFLVVFPMFLIGGVVGIIDWVKGTNHLREYMLYFVLAGAYFAISYGCGTSGGLAEGQAGLGVLFVVVALLQLFDYKWERLFRVIIVCSCLVFTLQSADKKMVNTYNWWGADEANFWDSSNLLEVPLLKGIAVSEDTKAVYEGIYQNVVENTNPDDSMVCFPQIPLFYSICDRKDPGLKAKVQWFDVSTDQTVMEDVEFLKANHPKIILIYDVSYYAISSHEKLFRDGNISGTQCMRETLYEIVSEYGYTHMGTFKSDNNTMSLWIQMGDGEFVGELFTGGNGTYEAPYEISSAQQLAMFAKMVNEGRTFEGQYVIQTADIDLSAYENWIPIGLFDGGNYFKGTYNGLGHVVRNMHCQITDDRYNLGLFGQLAGKVYNLGVIDSTVDGLFSGAIASHSAGGKSKIVNCYTDVTVNGIRSGGIADNFSGSVMNTVSTGDLFGTDGANALSYPSAKEVENVFCKKDSIDWGLYSVNGLYNPNIIYFEDDSATMEKVVNKLNGFCNTENNKELTIGTKEKSEEEIEEAMKPIFLHYWGYDGERIFLVQ